MNDSKKPTRGPAQGVRKRTAAPRPQAAKSNKRRKKRDGDVILAETDDSDSGIESIDEVEDDVPAKTEVQKVR